MELFLIKEHLQMERIIIRVFGFILVPTRDSQKPIFNWHFDLPLRQEKLSLSHRGKTIGLCHSTSSAPDAIWSIEPTRWQTNCPTTSCRLSEREIVIHSLLTITKSILKLRDGHSLQRPEQMSLHQQDLDKFWQKIFQKLPTEVTTTTTTTITMATTTATTTMAMTTTAMTTTAMTTTTKNDGGDVSNEMFSF